MHPPEFWWNGRSWLPRLLSPAAALYLLGGSIRRATAKPYRASVPVLCAGAATVGGSGKTPVALALASILQARGMRPQFLTRGYGGRLRGPVLVEQSRHGAAEVGDEPLLLAAAAPCWVAADRAAGARAAVAAGAQAIVMDDGLQNPSVAKDMSLLVVDGAEGFGNGWVLPAGPLREPLDGALSRAQAIVLVGDDTRDVALSLPHEVLVLRARFVLDPAVDALVGKPVLAFAGIGRPGKFFSALRSHGLDVIRDVPFPDHHPYSTGELEDLLAEAARLKAQPVTTAKDAVRLAPSFRDRITAIRGKLEWSEPGAVDALLRAAGIG